MTTMKAKHILSITICLGLILTFVSACKRNTVQEPSPFGPSSFATVLQVSCSPNVIFAGDTRQSTTVTATLKEFNGVPLSQKTVYFEVGDSAKKRQNIGYFEGNQTAVSRVTDENGVATINYIGPLATEITESGTVYIWATTAWSGKEFIDDNTALEIVQKTLPKYYPYIIANPNVLFAGSSKREKSDITVWLLYGDGSPAAVPNVDVHFWIGTSDTDETQLNIGYFDSHKAIVSKRTDENGRVAVQYWGPLAGEITQSPTTVYIWAKAAVAGQTAEDFVKNSTPVQIIQDQTTLTFTAGAFPNVIYTSGSTRPETKIKATVMMGPRPVKGRRIYFSIYNNGLGFFPDNKKVTYRTTNDNGIAQITYYGPKKSEMWQQELTITIRVQLETNTPESPNQMEFIDVLVRVIKSG
jgi:hypothetical protein